MILIIYSWPKKVRIYGGSDLSNPTKDLGIGTYTFEQIGLSRIYAIKVPHGLSVREEYNDGSSTFYSGPKLTDTRNIPLPIKRLIITDTSEHETK